MFLERILIIEVILNNKKEKFMKLNYVKMGLILFLMVFGFLLIPIPSHAAVDASSYIVENLKADDIPDDDGSGLVLSWKPLSK